MTHEKTGHTDKSGLNRLTLTELDKQEGDFYKQWSEESGCTVLIDEIENRKYG